MQAVTQNLSIFNQFANFMHEGGAYMWIILAVWIFGLVIALERIKSLYLYDIDAESFFHKIKVLILKNKVLEAINTCNSSKALLPQVVRYGLKRATHPKDQITDAIEAGISESIPKVDSKMSYLALVANISTLFGLLGTISGLIESFAAVANADPSSKAKLLALGIAKAMNTTAIGLVSAISIMVIHTILTNKGNKIIANIDHYSSKILDLLNSKNYIENKHNISTNSEDVEDSAEKADKEVA